MIIDEESDEQPEATAKDVADLEGVEEKKDDDGNVIGYVTKDEDGNEVEVTDSMAQCAAISEKCMGGHAVAIVGYDDNVEHYIIRNSWGEGWGEGGYFRILRGSDEAGIESTPAAGMPDMWD